MTKPNESRRERFVRLAEARTNKIIDMVKLLGNCSNLSNYEYTQDDVKHIFDAIEQEVKSAKARFKNADPSKKSKFTL